MWVRSLGWKDALKEEVATHSSILAWRIPWTEKPGGLQSPKGHKELDTTEWLNWTELNIWLEITNSALSNNCKLFSMMYHSLKLENEA